MKVHIFGGVWNPSCATYALRRTFQNHRSEFPDMVAQAEVNSYVDDLLMSLDSSNKASILACQLRRLLACGGFRLTKWASNHKGVLATIPPEERQNALKEIDLRQDKLPLERALGVRWLLEGDQLAIKVQPNSRPATRRGVLSLVNSIYDPLGFVAPSIIRAKILFQCECRRQLGWDEPLSAVNHTTWSTWLGELAHLGKLRVPRCLKTAYAKEIISAQLHTFCDASQAVYGAVTYLRMVDSGGSVQCSFVYGRAKLSPLKQLTIPRLELCAAVLAVNANQTIRREMTMTIHES
ncbi:uncharacterized protein LOC121857018 [Homarus americanus]|uniref:uncharacterized protein LOC121857018 n=1 Tax=Homarus americanus TaxID=6706 RepID=UPI001C46E9DF|nr:uncharacterized protein LOC121857018 [Homarus americanus]